MPPTPDHIQRMAETSILVPRVVIFSAVLPLLIMYGTAAWYMASEHITLVQVETQVQANRTLAQSTDAQLNVASQRVREVAGQIDVRLTRIETKLELMSQQPQR